MPPLDDASRALDRPTVSVVIPHFNGSRFIAQALKTVHDQTYAAHEIIVIDDASRVEERENLAQYSNACRLIQLPRNGGPSVARNVGIAAATGQWIAFLDCDDLWHERKLERQVGYIRTHPDCRALHTAIREIRVDGTETVQSKRVVAFNDFLDFPCPIMPSSVLMQRSALFECGLFDPTKRCCEDLDLFLRFCFRDVFHVIDEPLTIRRVQEDGLSRNIETFWREADRVYRDYRQVFADRAASRRTLIDVHVNFSLDALYARDFSLLFRMLPAAMSNDVPWTSIAPRMLWGLAQNRWKRQRQR